MREVFSLIISPATKPYGKLRSIFSFTMSMNFDGGSTNFRIFCHNWMNGFGEWRILRLVLETLGRLFGS
jgi:hypothetical protein